MKARFVRCFWRWPLGHRWEYNHEGRHQYKRCRECGKTKDIGRVEERHQPQGFE